MKKSLNYSKPLKRGLKNLLLISLAILTWSCSNENIDSSISQDMASIQYFDSKGDFEAKMASIRIDYEQLNSPDYNILSEVLNEDNVVGIGEYLIKIDLNTESVYTLKKSFSNEYNDLVAMNIKNNNINKLSVYNDVLSILDGSDTVTVAKSSCSSRAPSDYDYNSTSGNYQTLTLTARYRAYGIYFSLSYTCDPHTDYGYCRLDEWDIYYRKTNCATYSSYGENDYGDGEHEGRFTHVAYQGYTPLNSFHCNVKCSSSAGTVEVIIES